MHYPVIFISSVSSSVHENTILYYLYYQRPHTYFLLFICLFPKWTWTIYTWLYISNNVLLLSHVVTVYSFKKKTKTITCMNWFFKNNKHISQGFHNAKNKYFPNSWKKTNIDIFQWHVQEKEVIYNWYSLFGPKKGRDAHKNIHFADIIKINKRNDQTNIQIQHISLTSKNL